MLPTKIRKLYLPNYQQFQRCVVDFTRTDGRAADRICLIGRNGTGKSTILRILDGFLQGNHPERLPPGVAIEVEHDGRRIFLPSAPTGNWVSISGSFAGLDVTNTRVDEGALLGCESVAAIQALMKAAGASDFRSEVKAVTTPGPEILAYCPAETLVRNQPFSVGEHPKTSLNAALELFTDFPYRHEVSSELVHEMWRVLVYLIKKRENDRQTFETTAANLQKTKAHLIAEFDQTSPSVLEALARLWNRILAPAGLEFDVEGAKIPVQLKENLEAYIRVRDSKKRIPYNALSTGIRNFLFRIGHLFLLYFNRPIEQGFVLIDEPENSLFPDFLFELMSSYEEILCDKAGVTHTQLFVATHSPIVAAQFEPDERVVLEWRDDATVTASRGTSPKGDDPNDLLRRDFHLPELMGPEGVKNWREYLDLRRQIRHAEEPAKPELVARAMDIAQRYGFEPPR